MVKTYLCRTKDKGCGFINFEGAICLKGKPCYNRILCRKTKANK